MIKLSKNTNFIVNLIEANADELDGPVLEDGSTLLHVAVKMCNIDVVNTLVMKVSCLTA